MIVHPEEIEGGVAVDIEQHEDCIEISFETDDNLAPVFLLTSGLIPEALRMQMGSVIPYFLESILMEAGVDFEYQEIETDLIDQDYSAAIGFHIRRQDLPGFFETVRESGAASVYDFLFFHEDTEIILTHTDRLFLAGFDDAAIDDAVDSFEAAVAEGGRSEFPEDGGETEVVRYGQQDPPDGVPVDDADERPDGDDDATDSQEDGDETGAATSEDADSDEEASGTEADGTTVEDEADTDRDTEDPADAA